MNSCNSNNQKGDNKLIFKDDKGNQIYRSDLHGVTGSYNWAIKDDIEIPAAANK